MKYNVMAWLLAFQGEVEAINEEEVEQKIKTMCGYPPAGPIIIQYIDEQVEEPMLTENPEPEVENTL